MHDKSQYMKEYREKNKESLKEKRKIYVQQNKENINTYRKKYNEQNREDLRIKRQNQYPKIKQQRQITRIKNKIEKLNKLKQQYCEDIDVKIHALNLLILSLVVK